MSDTSQGHFYSPSREPLSLLITFKGNIFFCRLTGWGVEGPVTEWDNHKVPTERGGVKWGEKPAMTNSIHCYFIKSIATQNRSMMSDVGHCFSFMLAWAVSSQCCCKHLCYLSSLCLPLLLHYDNIWYVITQCSIVWNIQTQIICR